MPDQHLLHVGALWSLIGGKYQRLTEQPDLLLVNKMQPSGYSRPGRSLGGGRGGQPGAAMLNVRFGMVGWLVFRPNLLFSQVFGEAPRAAHGFPINDILWVAKAEDGVWLYVFDRACSSLAQIMATKRKLDLIAFGTVSVVLDKFTRR